MELQTIFPEPRKIELGGKPFVVREFKARELPQVLSLASTLSEVSQEAITALLDTQTDRIFKLLSSVAEVPTEQVQELSASDLLTLLEEVVSENIDFFVQRLPETIRRVTGKVTAGSTPSNS